MNSLTVNSYSHQSKNPPVIPVGDCTYRLKKDPKSPKREIYVLVVLESNKTIARGYEKGIRSYLDLNNINPESVFLDLK